MGISTLVPSLVCGGCSQVPGYPPRRARRPDLRRRGPCQLCPLFRLPLPAAALSQHPFSVFCDPDGGLAVWDPPEWYPPVCPNRSGHHQYPPAIAPAGVGLGVIFPPFGDPAGGYDGLVADAFPPVPRCGAPRADYPQFLAGFAGLQLRELCALSDNPALPGGNSGGAVDRTI